MGNVLPKRPLQKRQAITIQKFEDSVIQILSTQAIFFTEETLRQPLATVISFLEESTFFDVNTNENERRFKFLQFCVHPNFAGQMLKIFRFLIVSLEEINEKSLNSTKQSHLQILTKVCNMLFFVSEEGLISLLLRPLLSNTLSPELKEKFSQFQQKYDNIEEKGSLIDRMSENEKIAIFKLLRQTLIKFIKYRSQILSSSQHTMIICENSMFMLMQKVFLPNIATLYSDSHFFEFMRIGAYFLASGTNYIHPSIYETAVIFLHVIVSRITESFHSMQTIQSFYFKDLPIITSNSLYDFICCVIMFTLKKIMLGKGTIFPRFVFDRIKSLKLLMLLLEKIENSCEIMTYFLEQLCLQVKNQEIQRAFVYGIVQKYTEILKKDQKTQISQILSKFLSTKNLSYRLKIRQKEITISIEQILQILSKESDQQRNQYQIDFIEPCKKYIFAQIFKRVVNFNYSQVSLWDLILHQFKYLQNENHLTEFIKYPSHQQQYKQGKQESNVRKMVKMQSSGQEYSKTNGVLSNTKQEAM